ncbi:TetR/AcrR family transcriptional regulator [Actinomycetospora chibensis]|uniref:TetR/AcrR family transcriptional regulator n=1 Tax=Actinomycetospora chibensis TaxID=663606 RepID=A0ABV9RLQ8_9PSEU|nr:TetR/AcrR family transcriptional regulator [Actinomycetospora chibensis]MDD7925976.1 TetR/AcrR family transcriptional regulator [Actinomycetospora chibensis]
MPKQVDPHERRTLLADALLRVAATRGLMDVSLRHVAAEAGVTAGMVQHYFRTKDDMMVFALDVVSARVQARLEADPTTHDGPRAVVRALLVQLLPVDDDRVLEGRVAIAFHAYAASRPTVATRLREDTRGMRAMIAEQIRSAGRGALEPEQAATGLLSLVEGLAVHVLGGHVTADHAVATLDAHLRMAFGHVSVLGRPDDPEHPRAEHR